MAGKVYDLPNMQRFKLVLATESRESLYPVIEAIKASKAVLDADYAAASPLETALNGAGYAGAVPNRGGTDYGTVAAQFAADATIPAVLKSTNVDGLPKRHDAYEFPAGSYHDLVDFFKNLRLPVFNSPSQPGDDSQAMAEKLLANMQIVFDAHATLTARGFI